FAFTAGFAPALFALGAAFAFTLLFADFGAAFATLFAFLAGSAGAPPMTLDTAFARPLPARFRRPPAPDPALFPAGFACLAPALALAIACLLGLVPRSVETRRAPRRLSNRAGTEPNPCMRE